MYSMWIPLPGRTCFCDILLVRIGTEQLVLTIASSLAVRCQLSVMCHSYTTSSTVSLNCWKPIFSFIWDWRHQLTNIHCMFRQKGFTSVIIVKNWPLSKYSNEAKHVSTRESVSVIHLLTRPRTLWRDNKSHVAWKRLGILQDELENVAGKRDVWTCFYCNLNPG